MTLQGTVKNGMVLLDEPQELREGARVTIVVREDDIEAPTLASLLDLAGTVEGLPSDLARNHNHYLHGHPKK